MKITITEFAEMRGQDRDTINAYIRKHPEIKSYTIREGKNVLIDTECEGYALLDKKYPFPEPIQIIEDTESQKKLIQAQEMIIMLQSKITEQAEQIAQSRGQELLLIDKEQQLERAYQETDKLDQRNQSLENEIKELRMQLETEKNKSWISKLLGK